MRPLCVAVALAVFPITAPLQIEPAGAVDASGSDVEKTVLRAPPGAMAEAAVAIDPANTDHLVVAADPYMDPVRIVVRQSYDGGKTWSQPLQVIPPGFAKSYDPSIAVMPGGRAVVLGGASQQGATHCQPGSAIFVAELDGRDIGYSLVQEPKGDTYVDRPKMVSDPQTGAMFATWTRSVGSGAECLAAPLRSSIMFTQSLPEGTFARPVPLPSSGFPAPFGSSMAVGEAGSLHVAIRERDPDRADRILVVSSFDGGRSFSKPKVLATTRPFPAAIPGLGGFVSAIPVIAGDPETGLAVAWPSVESNGSRIDVAQRTRDGRWLPLRAFARDGGYELFPSISYDGAGRLWVLYARYSFPNVSFVLRHRGDHWSRPRIIGKSAASGYIEIGQFLGFTAVGDRILAAIPIDGTGSRLKIISKALEPSPTDEARTGESRSDRVDRNVNTETPGRWVIALIVAAAVVVGTVMLRVLRHRSGTRPDTMPASDTTDV
jgi:hypothetical protein